MISADDLAQMRADLLDVRDDHPAQVTLRRGETTLAAQSVRIARLNSPSPQSSLGAAEVRGRVVVLGDTSLDIQAGDHFNDGGNLYRVTFVRPNRTAGTMAECETIE